MPEETLKVYFDGECPLCKLEIDFYRKRSLDKNITWINIEDETFDGSKIGITKEVLKARFHVVKNDTNVFTGGHAFIQLWGFIPGFSWAATILGRSILPHVIDKIYGLFLLVRPVLQKILIKIEDKK